MRSAAAFLDVILLAVAAVLMVVAVVALRGALRPRRRCYYCGHPQTARRLEQVELSGAGFVDVCRDAQACRSRHLYDLAR